MKFISQLATLATIMAVAGSSLAVTCGIGITAQTTHVRQLRDDLASNGGVYRVTGRSISQFDQVATGKLQLRRVSGIPTGSTHVLASTVGDIVQNIIDDCCSGPFCCGNDDVNGDQGDRINVNIPCS